MKVVEVEGSHVLQNVYSSLDIHVGQSVTLLVTLDRPAKDFHIVASSRFTKTILTATGVLHYSTSRKSASALVPAGITGNTQWSMDQARSFR